MSTGIIDFQWKTMENWKKIFVATSSKLVISWGLDTTVRSHRAQLSIAAHSVPVNRFKLGGVGFVHNHSGFLFFSVVKTIWQLCEYFEKKNYRKMGLFESKILEGDFDEPQWLEQQCYFGLRCWHLGFFGFSGFVCIGQFLCDLLFTLTLEIHQQ